VDAADVDVLRKTLADLRLDDAVILTSFHQSPLPLALLLRLAGVPKITAISDDYPGTLLDVRHPATPGIPEAVRSLSVAEAAGYRLPAGDDGRLAIRRPLPDVTHLIGEKPYVVVHPGTSVPARAWAPAHHSRLVHLLRDEGFRVVVTGSDSETTLTSAVANDAALDLGGRTSFAELAAVLAGAMVVVVGNTGPAHLAAAVGTPVVSLFAPTVPASQWAPYGTRSIVLGDMEVACRDSRALVCPVPGHPCINSVSPAEVLQAVCGLLRVSA
jgi:ADP-heptose:LPS heptosyltransferase